MKRRWIEYSTTFQQSPMSFDVHRPVDKYDLRPQPRGAPRQPAPERAPYPKPAAGRGYPMYYVEFDGHIFQFASIAELDVMLGVFTTDPLPSAMQLARRDPYAHGSVSWLKRLPADTLSKRFRARFVPYLRQCRAVFVAETGGDDRGVESS